MEMDENNYRASHISLGHGSYYDKTYDEGFYKYQWIYLEQPMLMNIFQDLSKQKKVMSSLDFACGTGRITKLCEDYFERCTGVDVSDEMLKVASKKCPRTNLIRQDISHQILKEKFDVVTAFRFFLNAEHTLNIKILDSINQMLTDNGCLIANIHVNSNSVLGYMYRLRNKILNRNIANTMSFDTFNKYLEDAGFYVSQVYWYSYLPRVGWRWPWIYKTFMLPFEKMCISFHLLPRSMAQCFLVVAHKN